MFRCSNVLKIACLTFAFALAFSVGVSAKVTDFTPVVIDEETQKGDIPDGVWYGPLDLSGMSFDEARKSIVLYVMSLQDKEITLLGTDGRNVVKTAGELGLKWNDEEALLDAITLGKSGNIVSRFKELKDLETDNKKYDLKLSFDENALRNVVRELSSKFNVDPTETTMVMNEEWDEDEDSKADRFLITEGNTGYKLDESKTISNIKRYRPFS